MGRPKTKDLEVAISQQNRRNKQTENQRRRRQLASQCINDDNRTLEETAQVDHLGSMDSICEYCEARHSADKNIAQRGLSFNDCCGPGTVKLDG